MDEQTYLQTVHRINKILLKEIDRVCTENGITYYLICGGLLGAVRHKSFIPWDDDVDIGMTRKEFEKLKKIARKTWNKGDFLFVDYNEMGHGTFLDFLSRVMYMKEEVPVNIFQKIRGKGRSDLDNHIPIDIYVFDDASDNEKVHQRQTLIIQGLYGLAMGHRAYINYDEYKNCDEKRQKQIRMLTTVGRYIPLRLIFWAYEVVRKWNNGKPGQDYFESNGWIYCIPWRFKRAWFGKGVRLPIDDDLFLCPQDYDAFLKRHYVNYMELPPESSRKPSHSAEASGIFG